MGLSDDVGSLEIGKKADFFMIDSRKAHLVPTLRIVSSFVHNGSAGDITDVMIDGKWVMRDSSLTTIDEMTVISNAEKIGHRVWNKLVNDHPNVHFPIKLPPTTL